ncbi:hypothetical protein LEMLEM_LOCUS20793 [Lemmus lemmus]
MGGAGLGLPSPKRSGVLSGAPQRESGDRTHPGARCALALRGGKLRLRSLGAAKRCRVKAASLGQQQQQQQRAAASSSGSSSSNCKLRLRLWQAWLRASWQGASGGRREEEEGKEEERSSEQAREGRTSWCGGCQQPRKREAETETETERSRGAQSYIQWGHVGGALREPLKGPGANGGLSRPLPQQPGRPAAEC